MFKQLFFIFAKYVAKEGLILYCVRASEDFNPGAVSNDNVYLNTIYYKGDPTKIAVGELVELSCVKNEKGFVYGFI